MIAGRLLATSWPTLHTGKSRRNFSNNKQVQLQYFATIEATWYLKHPQPDNKSFKDTQCRFPVKAAYYLISLVFSTSFAKFGTFFQI